MKKEPLLSGGKTGQRAYLGQLANKAWKYLTSKGAIDEPADAWRKREAVAACGYRISEAPRRCFDDLETHFLAMAGQTKRAFDRATGPGNDERMVAHNIATTAAACGVGDSYVAGICRKMFHRPTWDGAREGQKVLVALSKALTRKNASKAV